MVRFYLTGGLYMPWRIALTNNDHTNKGRYCTCCKIFELEWRIRNVRDVQYYFWCRTDNVPVTNSRVEPGRCANLHSRFHLMQGECLGALMFRPHPYSQSKDHLATCGLVRQLLPSTQKDTGSEETKKVQTVRT